MFSGLDVGLSALLTDLAMCLNHYRLASPGLYCCVHATVQLPDGTRICPGLVVQVNHGPLKRCAPDEDDACIVGPPNFVLDVFSPADTPEYERRWACFERAGVFEYVAVRLADELDWTWNRLVDGAFTEVATEGHELILSAALPGLWIPSHALKTRNWWSVIAAIDRGVSRRGHHQFMQTIWEKSRSEDEAQQAVDDYLSGRMGRQA